MTGKAKFRVFILASAEQDLKEFKAHVIKNFSLSAWQNTFAGIKETIRHLEYFPQPGFISEEIEKLNLTQYRQVLSGMNRIIYEIRHGNIYVHLIADARRDMYSLLTRRLLRAN